MSYTQEGYDDHDPPDWVTRNLEDYSWSQDAGPKWILTDDPDDEEAPTVVVWVFHPNPSEREEGIEKRYAVDVLPTGHVNYDRVHSMSVVTDSVAEMTEAVVRAAEYLGLKKIPKPVPRVYVTMWKVLNGNRVEQLWPGAYSQGTTDTEPHAAMGELDNWFQELEPDLGLDQEDLGMARAGLEPMHEGQEVEYTIVPEIQGGDGLVLQLEHWGGLSVAPAPSAVKSALEEINRARARSGERRLDPAAAGWTDEDVLIEAKRLQSNPMSAAERKVLGAVLRANAQGRRAPRTKRNAVHMGALQRAGHLVVNPTGAWVTGETAESIVRGRL